MRDVVHASERINIPRNGRFLRAIGDNDSARCFLPSLLLLLLLCSDAPYPSFPPLLFPPLLRCCALSDLQRTPFAVSSRFLGYRARYTFDPQIFFELPALLLSENRSRHVRVPNNKRVRAPCFRDGVSSERRSSIHSETLQNNIAIVQRMNT